MEKLKVSEDIFNALNHFCEFYENPFNDAMKIRISGGKFKLPSNVALNKLSIEDLAICLIVGYELEDTPEEILAKHYNIPCNDEYCKAFNQGIEFSLNTLGLKIKGINA